MSPFEDSRALIARAKAHYQELVGLWHRERRPPLWSLDCEKVDGQFSHRVKLDRTLLVQMRPVMADTANNIVAALDHLVAAAARMQGVGREVRTYFPWLFDDDAFRKALGTIGKWTGAGVVAAIEDIWFNRGFERPHLHATKELSNLGKHWELLHSTSGAHAVQIVTPGSQQIVQVPRDAFDKADTFEFLRTDQPVKDMRCYIVLSLAVRGLPEGLPTSPDSIFECSLRLAERIIDAVESRI